MLYNAKTKNNTYPIVATGSVEFKTECLLLSDYHAGNIAASIDIWEWLTPDFNQFKTPYQVRSPAITHTLPKVIPKLPSLEVTQSYTIFELCGGITYGVTNLDSDLF